MGKKKTNTESSSITNEEEVALNRLVKNREYLLKQFAKFEDFLNNIREGQLLELQIRTEKIQSLVDEIEIEIRDVDPHFEIDPNFDSQYYRALAAARRLLSPSNGDNASMNSNGNSKAANPNSASGAKLPQIGIPHFSGDYKKYTQFKETFDSLINKNSSLDNIQKFYYLLDALEGDAKRVLDSLEITNENYKIAWQLLETRFDNKPAIIHSYLKGLFDIPVIQEKTNTGLRKLSDTIQQNTRALKTLGEPVDSWDRLILFFMTRKLDKLTNTQWEQISISKYKGEPSLQEFLDFIDEQCRILETVELNKPRFAKGEPKQIHKFSHSVTADYKTRRFDCPLCKLTHPIFKCDKLLALNPQERKNRILELKLCLNCLNSNHLVRDCNGRNCRHCNRKHNSILCFGEPLNRPGSAQGAQGQNNIVATSCSKQKFLSQVLLSTAVVLIKDSKNKFIKCRALLDSGSQVNFISSSLAKRLNLSLESVHIPIVGVDKVATNVNHRVNTTIKSRHDSFDTNLSFLVINNVTSEIPVNSFDLSSLEIPKNVNLADPHFNVTAKIDVLIGAGIFYNLLRAGQIRLANGLIMQKTVFGWIVSGGDSIHGSYHATNIVCNLASTKHTVSEQIERFWAMEEIQPRKFYSTEELECEQHFVKTTTRDETGRFCVELPLKDEVDSLGDSLDIATRRFHNIERKLSKNSALAKQYHDFMQEYLELGHMEKVENYKSATPRHINYLPHHCVVNESSLTTKMRVVFDASCKTTSGISLNDVLRVGPTIQDELFNILLRFRKHNIVFTADIAKMYRQIRIVPEQRDLQRIVWRSNPNAELSQYRLNTVTYGTAPASFLSTRCLQQIAENTGERNPSLGKIITEDFYVDDLISGAASVEEAVNTCIDLARTLEEYGFPLRKWSSNKVEVLQSLSNIESENIGYFITDNEVRKTLGVRWKPKSDTLEYVATSLSNRPFTKRGILSVISRIFDPLGLAGPITVRAKLLMQQLWRTGCNWDETIPAELQPIWSEFHANLQCLSDISIPRHCILENATAVEIIGFCDASTVAYGAAIYLKSADSDGCISVRLLCAKSRVAPIKVISTPKLELSGALLLARLIEKVRSALCLTTKNIYLFTDSEIVLAWLADQPSSWQVFVANRVSEIQILTKEYQWYHVSSKDNPADIISRGMEPTQLRSCNLWWAGPDWLKCPKEIWPVGSTKFDTNAERRKVNVTFVNSSPDFSIFQRFSSLFKLVRVTALCLRFKNNCKLQSNQRYKGTITLEEMNTALYSLIRVAQNQIYSKEISELSNSKLLSKSSPIRALDPFMKDGILRVGGRIRNSNESFNTKFPIILPQKHPLTKLIILDQHHKNLHAGLISILNSLRKNFWPINAKFSIKAVLSKCVTCFRIKPINSKQKMGDLPRDRVTPQRPFHVCGVDFAGPFLIKDGKLRNRALVKCYMCIFVCFVTKAVHIELVGDLSTESFLNCLKRFVSRRGLCRRIYSDNATNFVGANNELCKVMKEFTQNSEIQAYCSRNSIEWQYIPPRSPHQGGLWEGAIKSAKRLITKVVGLNKLTYEALYTIFTQVEAVLNSRPLSPLSNDPKDLLPLTPGHFLIGDALNAVPQRMEMNISRNRLDYYQRLQQMFQEFWTRWSSEYLSTLQQRSKWQQSVTNLQVDNLVVLKDDNLAPLQWKLGRIVEVHPGKDGLVRSVSVRTSGGVLKRAVQKVCVLPVDTNQ